MLPAELPRHRFSVEEYRRMGEAGLFAEDDRVELIRGEIVDMNPIGAPHAACVTNLTHTLVEKARGRFFVSVQNSFGAVDDSEPQPDFCLLRKRPSQSDEEIPSGEGLFIAIEVSDATLAYDRNVKLPLYAETGIPEAWIVDLQNKKVEVYSEPSPDGYKAMRIFAAGEEVRSTAIEGLAVPVDEVMA
ncbi:MAG: Uma2 family endonuclease [Rubrobacteraceae bacterium]